jgi:predicted MFS family arabinose efflux permease
VSLPPFLWVLTAGAFAVGTDAYVIAGVLPELSHDLHVPTSTAGQLVTVFAAAYAVMAPVSASIAGSWSRRAVLAAALAVFATGNVLTALANGYPIVLVGRVISAAGAASFTPQACAAASSLVDPRLRSRALAVVVGGLTAATVLGVPLGTIVAGAFGWRATTLAVAAVGATAMCGAAALLPKVPAPERHSLGRFADAVREPDVRAVLMVSFLTTTAEQTIYPYVAPVLARATRGQPDTLSVLLLVFGVGAVIGNSIAGVTTQRFGSRWTLVAAVGGMAVDLASLPWWSAALPSAVVGMFVWGLTGWMYVVPQQYRLLTSRRGPGSLAVALNNSVFYLGTAAGGALGAAAVSCQSTAWLAVSATLLAALAVATASLTYKPRPTQPHFGATRRR